MFAARDHIGIVSLFVGFGFNNELYFSSELKAIVDSCAFL
jgi:asparagine synthetase B (glutamine-hydrolysing)